MSDALAARAPRGFPWDEALRADLIAAYGAPGRHYHTLAHVEQVAESFQAVAEGPGWRDPLQVYLAVLAHDAVYDPARTDNEARSADLARAWAARLGLPADGAAALILATANHAAARSDDPDLGAFLDCDLSILGADPDRYDAYARGVEAEYTAVVPQAAYRAGRARFLEQMLASASLFHTPFFRERHEERARINLARERSRL